MKKPEKIRYVVFDLETSGVHAEADVLEVGAIVIDPLKGESLSEFSTIVSPRSKGSKSFATYFAELEPVVFAMHQGLLAEFSEAFKYPTVLGAEEMLLDHLALDEDEKVMLVGQSIHFDRRFVERDMPRLAKRLHHRMLDLSTITTMLKLLAPKEHERLRAMRPAEPAHRALQDCRYALSLFRDYCHFFDRAIVDIESERVEEEAKLFRLYRDALMRSHQTAFSDASGVALEAAKAAYERWKQR